MGEETKAEEDKVWHSLTEKQEEKHTVKAK